MQTLGSFAQLVSVSSSGSTTNVNGLAYSVVVIGMRTSRHMHARD